MIYTAHFRKNKSFLPVERKSLSAEMVDIYEKG